MSRRSVLGGSILAVGLMTGGAPSWAQQPVPARPTPAPAARLFQARCASCHQEEPGYAPSRRALGSRTRATVVHALTKGGMRNMATGLTIGQIQQLAAYVGAPPRASVAATQLNGRPTTTAAANAGGLPNRCMKAGGPILLDAKQWNGWGRDAANSRYQAEERIKPSDVPLLRVKWAFGYDMVGGVFSQPTLVGDRVFVSTIPGKLYALDAATGCAYWSYATGVGARTSVVVGNVRDSLGRTRVAAFIGDNSSWVHAVDAMTGAPLWKVRVDDHGSTRLTGSSVLHEGRLYVPVSSLEEATAMSPKYECCTFRGSVVALDASSGKFLWKSHTIPDEPRPFGRSRIGTVRRGPAGAPIWSTPTIDVAKGRLYATTGNSYTDAPQKGSSAVLAMDLGTGRLLWGRQGQPDAAFIVSCLGRPQYRETPVANCPDTVGQDFDFGASPILRTLPGGKRLLIAGDKGGMVYAMDPDDEGKIAWTARVGRGSTLGGIEWGMAADDELVYVGVSDDRTLPREEARPGLTALRLATGEVAWRSPAPPGACSWSGDPELCSNGLSAALTLIPGVVLAPSLDGHIRAYSTRDGGLLWAYDTARIYETVNGIKARGGSLDAAGISVANGMMFVNSGYDRFTRRQAGNVLLAFSIGGK